VKDELLELLCEPDTGAELKLAVAERRGGQVWTGNLCSKLTGREYPIRAGIPRFVPAANYSESFGLQWNRFAKVQLDSANGARYSHRRFGQEVGWSASQLRGRWVLDAGCGCGRFAEVAAELGARVLALDYSSAVDAAARNLGHLPDVHFVQGDLLHPPIRAGSLPFVYSIGVVQHTPDPPAALASVLGLAAPGGRFAFSIYARRWYTRFNAKYLVRPLTRRLSPAKLLRAVEAAMPVVFPFTEFAFSLPLVGRLARFTIPVANYTDKTDFSRKQRYQEAVLDTFDMLSPAFDNPMTAGEVRQVFRRLGIQDFRFLQTVPINVVGWAPLCASEANGERSPRVPLRAKPY
jgi:SAM-dependent methyltransferase